MNTFEKLCDEVRKNMDTEIGSRMTNVFRDVFALPNLRINETDSQEQIACWDSMGHVRLVIALEEEFDIQFESDEIAVTESVGALAALISTKMES
jgi:acyl carrier protein